MFKYLYELLQATVSTTFVRESTFYGSSINIAPNSRHASERVHLAKLFQFSQSKCTLNKLKLRWLKLQPQVLFTNVSWCGINSYEIHCALINKSETIEKGNCIYSSVEVKLIFDCYSVVYSLATEPESSTKMLLFKIFL